MNYAEQHSEKGFFMSFDRSLCGCPVQTSMYPYRCISHAIPRDTLPDEARHGTHAEWYIANTCPFCGRVNPFGLACSYVNVCNICGVRSCADHNMACYRLNIHCPRLLNKRTKHGKQFLKSVNAFVQGLRNALNIQLIQ